MSPVILSLKTLKCGKKWRKLTRKKLPWPKPYGANTAADRFHRLIRFINCFCISLSFSTLTSSSATMPAGF